jgi:glycosyltransferase involved in cell wall biosynthesis
VIVHTRAGRDTLLRRGVPVGKLVVIPHGPLKLHTAPSSRAATVRTDDRWTFALFGEIKPYKGVDLLVEALALLPPSVRERARFIVAGRPRMDVAPLVARVLELGLEEVIEIRAHRLSEEEMAVLFAETDCFLFPYRQVDASGVYFLVKSLGKWIIASKVGVFAEDLQEDVHGALIAPNDPRALADAIELAVAEHFAPRPASSSSDWTSIGSATRDVYLQARTTARRVFALAPVGSK